jgi:hypothetical protein
VALKSDGSVVAWGYNDNGQTTVPVGLTGVVAIAAGGFHTVALKSDGSVVAWGSNFFGQTNVPAGLSKVAAIAQGSSADHVVVLIEPAAGFGQQALTTSTTKTFTIKNTGIDTLAISSVSVSSGNASDFTVSTAGMLTSVPALTGETTFSVTFTPSVLGLRQTTLRVVSNDSDEGIYDIVLIGDGSPDPTIVVEQPAGPGNGIDNGGSKDIGSVELFSSGQRVFTVKNTGHSDLALTGGPLVLVSGSSEFIVTEQPASPITGPSGSTTFTVVFTPRMPGLRTATVNIASNDLANPYFNFTLTGLGALTVPRPQTIAFTPAATVYLSQSPLALTATASSGLPVTLSLVSGPATLTDGTLTLTGPGILKVLATQAGGSNYAAAAAVTRSIVVADDPTTLTLLDLAQVYDGTPKSITTIGTATPAIITYKVGGVFSTTAPTHADSYPVKAVADGVTKTGTLVIAKATLTVTPDDLRKFRGEANPELTRVISGLIGSDTESIFTQPIVLTTTATVTSASGQYPIKASGAAAANYGFNYQQGTLVVESFAGNYKALLVDDTTLPVGKLSITVAANSKDFTGKLYTATETTALSIKGKLTPDLPNELATGTATVTKNSVPYVITFTLPFQGDVLANVTRNGLAFGSATDGRKMLALAKGESVAYAGAYTAVLQPVLPADTGIPAGAGWATATISSAGVLTMVGKLADGAAFTSSLPADTASAPGYRLWMQPYKAARPQAYLAGGFTLLSHPTVANRRYLEAANMTWKKAGLTADTSYRDGFNPVTTVLTLDPWQKPMAAMQTTPAITLATRLGLPGTSFTVSHSATGSASDANLPTSAGLSVTNVVSVQAPLTAPLNITKWKATLNATTGSFTGSFELLDGTQKRPVSFNGVLRQPATALDTVIGDGNFQLPALTGALSKEKLSGEVMFQRP